MNSHAVTEPVSPGGTEPRYAADRREVGVVAHHGTG